MTKTAIAVEIAVLLTVVVVVEWLEHVLTNTRETFVPAVVVLGVYAVVRVALSARRRRADELRGSR